MAAVKIFAFVSNQQQASPCRRYFKEGFSHDGTSPRPARNKHGAHPWATRGFFRMCCPNRSVLKIGFLVPDDEGPELSFVGFLPDFLVAGFTEGSCPREKRSEVALGMAGHESSGGASRNVRRVRNKKRVLPNRANRSYQITPTTTDPFRPRPSWASS